MTDEQHNKYLAWTFLAHGAFQTLMMLLIFVMFGLMFSLPTRPGDQGPPVAFFGIFFAIMFLVQMVFTLPSFIAAYGLLKKKHWARIAAIVAGIVSAMNVPIGTAACVYSLWFFMGENWKSIYPQHEIPDEREPYKIQNEVESRWSGYHTDETGQVSYRPVEPPDWR